MITNPREIENTSFEIIKNELPNLNCIPAEHLATIVRIIHTTADFEYASLTEISDSALSRGLSCLKEGCTLYTDTRMIMAGVNKTVLQKLGCSIITYIDDPQVAAAAREQGITRSIVGMQKALEDESIKIFVIGNAPTALYTLIEAVQHGKADPALVIGVPVGFVGAAESKVSLKTAGVPYIVTNGRKGGSTVAAAIVNSLLYRVVDER